MTAAPGPGGIKSPQIEHLDARLSSQIEQLADTVERNHRELQHSLGNHYHNEAGDAVFTAPPGAE